MFVYFCYFVMESEKFVATIVKQQAIYSASTNLLFLDRIFGKNTHESERVEVNHDDDAGPSTVNNNNISSTINEDHNVSVDASLSAKKLQESVNDSLCDTYDYGTDATIFMNTDILVNFLKETWFSHYGAWCGICYN